MHEILRNYYLLGSDPYWPFHGWPFEGFECLGPSSTRALCGTTLWISCYLSLIPANSSPKTFKLFLMINMPGLLLKYCLRGKSNVS